MEIKKVNSNKKGVKIICIPKKSDILDGDFVVIQKINQDKVKKILNKSGGKNEQD